jgi:diguanylate cyclase (GGDEF)-like protein
VEGRYYNRQAHLLWGLLGASVIRDRDGAPLYLICQIQDITARKEQEQRLLRQAQHDALTSLPNRLLFMERLQRALNGAHQRGESIGVMYLDLDGFKSVNDTFGHLVGDQLLAEVGKRLSRCIRGGDTVARLGGDEFSIIVGSVLDQETATRIAARVIEEFTRPFTVGTASVTVGVSIGISFSAPAHTDPDTLLHEADVALYQAKAAGKRRFVVYRRDLTPEQEDQLLAERTTDWRAPATRSDEG